MSCACSPIAPLLSPSSLIASPVERVFDTMPSRQPCRVLTGTWGQLVRRDPIAPGSGAQERPGPARGRRPAKQARALAQLAEEAWAPAWTGACADLTASPRDDRRLRSGDRLQRLGLGLRELDRAGAGEGLRPAARGRARPAAAPAVDEQAVDRVWDGVQGGTDAGEVAIGLPLLVPLEGDLEHDAPAVLVPHPVDGAVGDRRLDQRRAVRVLPGARRERSVEDLDRPPFRHGPTVTPDLPPAQRVPPSPGGGGQLGHGADAADEPLVLAVAVGRAGVEQGHAQVQGAM